MTRQRAPCIIFIDEPDVVGRQRGASDLAPIWWRRETWNILY